MKNIFLTCTGLLLTTTAITQSNFSYTPQNPQAGSEIKFSYTPAGNPEANSKLPETYVVKMGSKTEIIDLPLKRENGKLTGTYIADTSASLLAFGFSIDNKIDNNSDNGYLIPLYVGDSLKRGTNANIALIYDAIGRWKLGMKSDPQKALGYYEKEFALYPDRKEALNTNYLQTLYRSDKEKGTAAIQAVIEKTLKASLKTEEAYSKIIDLYGLLRLQQQQFFFSKLKKEKFPNAKLSIEEYYNNFVTATDVAQKESIIKEVANLAVNEKIHDAYKPYLGAMQSRLLGSFAEKKDWNNFKRYANQLTDMKVKMEAYNAAAWKMQEDSANLPLATELSKQTVEYAKEEIKNPKGPKPEMSLNREWVEERKNAYATFADTYGMVLYKSGKYKQGLPYAKEAALSIAKGKNTDENGTYAMLAEKALSPGKYKSQLEQFVRDGKANNTVKDVLKRAYITEKKSDAGYDAYMTQLEQEAILKLREELKKAMLNEATPQFTLNDLTGNKVAIADLKGKTVIVDFWATWCGPCKASFPGMQKMVTKYKDNADVQFLFVNTWEQEDNKLKNASDFIAKNNYSFQVLLDNDSKVVSQFKVSGIPTKFVIGKDGNIKFKAVGFDGAAHLEQELDAMIELTN